MNANHNFQDSLKEDERRRRDESRINALQTQVDELRSLVRELASRQGRSEEGFKNYEAGLAELRGKVDQHRHEVTQAGQARQLEDARIRQQISELDERIDETNKPIRALQAHVAQIVESMRRERDDEQEDVRRFEEIKSSIDRVAALAERNADVAQGLRDSIDEVRHDHDQTQRDVVKVDDSVRIVEQDARRRVAEVSQEIENLETRVEELRPYFPQLEAMIEEVRDSVKHVDPKLEELEAFDQSMQGELVRLYNQANERDDTLSERIDELRVQLDAQVRDVRQRIDQQYNRLDERLDGFADGVRELSYRLNMIDMRLDELHDADIRIRREVWHLHEMQTRTRLDQLQSELESVAEERRTVEAELDQYVSGSSNSGSNNDQHSNSGDDQ